MKRSVCDAGDELIAADLRDDASCRLRCESTARVVVGAVSIGALLLTGTALVAAIRTDDLGLISAAAIGVIFTALALSALHCLRGGSVELPGGRAAAPADAPHVIRGNVASPFSCSSRSRVL